MTPRPRFSPSHARARGLGTFPLFLHCVWAQLSSSGIKVSGTAIRGKPAKSKRAAESPEVLSFLPDNELASFSNHLSLSVTTPRCSHRRRGEHGGDVCLRRGFPSGSNATALDWAALERKRRKHRQVRGSCPVLQLRQRQDNHKKELSKLSPWSVVTSECHLGSLSLSFLTCDKDLAPRWCDSHMGVSHT